MTTATSLWRKLAHRLAARSEQDRQVLQQKGLGTEFNQEGLDRERDFFRRLCQKFTNHKVNWGRLQPVETQICCTPSEVNRTFGFSWSPNWFWANKEGWICAFRFHKNLLLVGVIETLQV